VVPHQLVVDVDQAAGVDDVVRRVEDAALVNGAAVALLVRQLVVGAARHDLAPQSRQSLWIEDGPERAGGEDLAVHVVDLGRRHDLDADFACPIDGVAVDVATEQLGALLL